MSAEVQKFLATTAAVRATHTTAPPAMLFLASCERWARSHACVQHQANVHTSTKTERVRTAINCCAFLRSSWCTGLGSIIYRHAPAHTQQPSRPSPAPTWSGEAFSCSAKRDDSACTCGHDTCKSGRVRAQAVSRLRACEHARAPDSADKWSLKVASSSCRLSSSERRLEMAVTERRTAAPARHCSS